MNCDASDCRCHTRNRLVRDLICVSLVNIIKHGNIIVVGLKDISDYNTHLKRNGFKSAFILATMSRRASIFAKENPGSKRPQVRFPDELVFLDNIKENDMEATYEMLRRASVTININGIGDSGMTPLHQAVLDGNLTAVRLLIRHGADINKIDDDSWTPLHAACAEGHSEICSYLLEKGAVKSILTEDGERPIDLVDPQDFKTVAVMLSHGRNSPPPNFRNHNDEDDDDEEDEEEEEEEEEDYDDDFEETKAPIAVSLPPRPLKSCLKAVKKLTIQDDTIAEGVQM